VRIELERLRAAGHEWVMMIDEIFGHDPRWLDGFCELVAPLGLNWSIQTRSECLSPQRLERMIRAGCASIEVGLESADPAVLRGIGKQTDYQKLAENVRAASRHGIRQMRLFCVFGAPGESRASLRKTEEFLLQFAELPAVEADVYPMLPLPGTGVWELARRQGLALADWADVERFAGIVGTISRTRARSSGPARVFTANGIMRACAGALAHAGRAPDALADVADDSVPGADGPAPAAERPGAGAVRSLVPRAILRAVVGDPSGSGSRVGFCP